MKEYLYVLRKCTACLGRVDLELVDRFGDASEAMEAKSRLLDTESVWYEVHVEEA